ncbi:hypothetical protein [Citrobacter sedlakii]|uniref:hypothetical protein n=1 Tax=Citrobacter sedlakii TaxID=67826 RepID=UPI00197DA239|nr:hypothetical protein [Citrobacter sedlakii]MBN6599943.1 hypothetical protein [Citrobacter sedlakii]
MSDNDKKALREELSNPAIGSKDHLRKMALALLDKLETDKEQIKTLESRNRRLEGIIDVAEKRIAELEEHTITLEPFRSFVTDADIAALHRFAECCDDPESGGHDLEKEQVRRLESIGALQRSGRISYITSFGDVLISITDGIGKGEKPCLNQQ